MSAAEDRRGLKKKSLKTYLQLVKKFLRTYASDDVIEHAEADIMNYKQLESMFTIFYLEKHGRWR